MGCAARARQSGVMSAKRESPRLYGRQAECDRLAKLVDGVRDGGSAVLVVHGEQGTGKTALLDFTAGLDTSPRVVRVAGAESETELAFGGLHRLCGTMLDLLGRLPGPQREALEIAFGRQAGTGPDRFLVGLAVLGLLAESAADHPLVVRDRRRALAGPGVTACSRVRGAAVDHRTPAAALRRARADQGPRRPAHDARWAGCAMRTPVTSWPPWCGAR